MKMKVKVFKNSEELGKAAASYSAEILNKAIKKRRSQACPVDGRITV